MSEALSIDTQIFQKLQRDQCLCLSLLKNCWASFLICFILTYFLRYQNLLQYHLNVSNCHTRRQIPQQNEGGGVETSSIKDSQNRENLGNVSAFFKETGLINLLKLRCRIFEIYLEALTAWKLKGSGMHFTLIVGGFKQEWFLIACFAVITTPGSCGF